MAKPKKNSFGTTVVINEGKALSKLIKAVDFVKANSLYVGIPQDDTKRKSGGITNAELLFIHTYGSQKKHIPARPVIEPAIEANKDILCNYFKKAITYAANGYSREAMAQLHKTGMKAQNICRAWFVDPRNGWPPNSLAVQRRKLAKKATIPRPLIDTAQMKNSITYVIETGKGSIQPVNTIFVNGGSEE